MRRPVGRACRASEWPQARPASGHARPDHGLRQARRPGAGASGGSGDNYYLNARKYKNTIVLEYYSVYPSPSCLTSQNERKLAVSVICIAITRYSFENPEFEFR
jgi:hypothetical protein